MGRPGGREVLADSRSGQMVGNGGQYIAMNQ